MTAPVPASAGSLPRLWLRGVLCVMLGAWCPAPAAQPFRPNLGPDPPRITVTCGDVTLLLRQASQWTPGRIDFRGTPLTTERSAYGTVLSFPGVGFIGTAHLENEPEHLLSLRFVIDDRALETPAAELRGDSFRLERSSRIRQLSLSHVFEIRNHRLLETVTLENGPEPVPLTLLYHFMHAWTPTVNAFLAGRDDAPARAIAGPLTDDPATARRFHVNEQVDWIAVREPRSGHFAVSRLLAAPQGLGHISMIWNVPGSYRKFYLKCFEHQGVPAGFRGTWRMVTAFGTAPEPNWENQARALAASLRR